MDATALLVAIGNLSSILATARIGIAAITRQAELLSQDGKISPEQLEAVKATAKEAAAVTDAEWDQLVALAKVGREGQR